MKKLSDDDKFFIVVCFSPLIGIFGGWGIGWLIEQAWQAIF